MHLGLVASTVALLPAALGIAAPAISKPMLLLCDQQYFDAREIPFDFASYELIEYTPFDAVELRERLTREDPRTQGGDGAGGLVIPRMAVSGRHSTLSESPEAGAVDRRCEGTTRRLGGRRGGRPSSGRGPGARRGP